MKLPIGIMLDLPVDTDELNAAIEWYASTCKHDEPHTIEAHAELGAKRFAMNCVNMHREVLRIQRKKENPDGLASQ